MEQVREVTAFLIHEVVEVHHFLFELVDATPTSWWGAVVVIVGKKVKTGVRPITHKLAVDLVEPLQITGQGIQTGTHSPEFYDVIWLHPLTSTVISGFRLRDAQGRAGACGSGDVGQGSVVGDIGPGGSSSCRWVNYRRHWRFIRSASATDDGSREHGEAYERTNHQCHERQVRFPAPHIRELRQSNPAKTASVSGPTMHGSHALRRRVQLTGSGRR